MKFIAVRTEVLLNGYNVTEHLSYGYKILDYENFEDCVTELKKELKHSRENIKNHDGHLGPLIDENIYVCKTSPEKAENYSEEIQQQVYKTFGCLPGKCIRVSCATAITPEGWMRLATVEE